MKEGTIAEVLAGDAAPLTIAPSGASFNRGNSKQDYATPRDFVRLVEGRFGRIDLDLAADTSNAVCDEFIGEKIDSFQVDWREALRAVGGGLAWLNPPFGNIAPWAAKCAVESARGCRIALLVPASVGSNWFRDHVIDRARVMFLNPRLSFDGKNPFPKDCLLAVYGEKPGCEVWKWR